MQQKITPFLWFNDQVEEALNFYTSVFKNGKVVSLSRQGDNGPVFSGVFEIEGQRFYAMNGGPLYEFTPAISFFVNCPTQEEIDEMWDKLTANGGKESRCGWLVDKYGLSWQIVPPLLGELLQGKDPKKVKAVMDAMLQMNKLIIADLQKAYEQA
jgi:predicted 3-demethylubiquinone-9 3-methyltransferase (glyoxalase superfamily)